MKQISLFFGLFLIFATQSSAQAKSTLYDFKVKKIKTGIYMAYRPEPLRKFVESNVTIIINDRDVVLVDGGGSTTSAKNIIAEVRKLTKNPIRYIINSHPHADHILGNQEYVRAFPGVEIISTTYTRADIIKNTPPYIESYKKNLADLRQGELELIDQAAKEAKPGYQKVVAYLARYANKDIYTRATEYAKLSTSPPTLICDQKMTLYRGARTIEILHIGSGDTPGDMIVYLPQDKVVCSGDMVVHPFPYGFSKNPLEWIQSLKKLDSLQFDYLIPGHGDLQSGKTYINDVIDLLQSVHDQAKTYIEQGASKETLQDQLHLNFFVNKYVHDDPVALYRFKRWFVIPAVEEACKIYSGNPLNPYGMFRGNLQHIGIYPSAEVRTKPKILWRFKTGGYVNSSAAIEGNNIYFGSADGYFYCVDASTGSQIWKYQTKGVVESSAAVANGSVFFGSHDGNFYSLNAKDGTSNWIFKTGGEKSFPTPEIEIKLKNKPEQSVDDSRYDTWTSSPAVKSNTVYFGSGDGNFYALDKTTGKLKWSYRTGHIIHSSPALAFGNVYIGGWDTYLHALNEETGEEKWKFKTEDDTVDYIETGITSSPVIVDSMLFFGCRDSHIYALNAVSGKFMWKKYNSDIWVSSTPLVYEDKVLISAGRPNKFKAYNKISGDSIYMWPTKTGTSSSLSLAGKIVYYGDLNGFLNAHDVNSGKLLWSFQIPTSQEDPLHIFNQKDLVVSQEGFSAAVEKYKGVKGRNEVRFSLGAIHSSPVVKDSVIFFGAYDGYFYALK